MFFVCLAKQMKIMETNKVDSVRSEDLANIQTELRNLSVKWVGDLVEQMSKDETLDVVYREIDKRKVYNIFSNVIRDRFWKMIVYSQAQKLRDKYVSVLEGIS